MKVKDTFAYCSAKVPMLVTEGVGKVLFDGDRNEMPEELEELTAARFEFLFHERRFWVAVEAQKKENREDENDNPVTRKYYSFYDRCDNCKFLDLKGYQCRIKRERIENTKRTVCCVYSRRDGVVDERDTEYQFQIVARRAFLDPSDIAGDVSTVACADCAFFHKEKKKCFVGVRKDIDENTVCGCGKKRSDYE